MKYENWKKARQQLDPFDVWNIFWSIVTWVGRLRTLYWLVDKFGQLFKRALRRVGRTMIKTVLSDFWHELRCSNVDNSFFSATRYVNTMTGVVLGAHEFLPLIAEAWSYRSHIIRMKLQDINHQRIASFHIGE